MAKDMKQPPEGAYAFIGPLKKDRIWWWKETPTSGDRAMLDGWHQYPKWEQAARNVWKLQHGVLPDEREGYVFVGPLAKDGVLYVVPPWVDQSDMRPNVLYIAGDIMSLAEWEVRARATRDKQGDGSVSPWLILVAAWLVLRR